MCQSKAQGGQRCFKDTCPTYMNSIKSGNIVKAKDAGRSIILTGDSVEAFKSKGLQMVSENKTIITQSQTTITHLEILNNKIEVMEDRQKTITSIEELNKSLDIIEGKSSNRGSSSELAKDYKAEGHNREAVVAELLPDGIVYTGTKKADIEYTYENRKVKSTVKGGTKWQLMDYSYNRLSETETNNDNDFINGQNKTMADALRKKIDCFPTDYTIYEADKSEVKNLLKTYTREEVDKMVDTENNTYIQGKVKLQKVSAEFAKTLSDKKELYNFLDKAMFDNATCEHLTVVKNNVVYVYDRKQVLDTLTDKLYASTSNAGRRKDDYNMDGQKVVLKSDFNIVNKANPEGRTASYNVIEVEVRNDSKQHYRTIQVNMLSKKALQLLDEPLYKIPVPTHLQSNATK